MAALSVLLTALLATWVSPVSAQEPQARGIDRVCPVGDGSAAEDDGTTEPGAEDDGSGQIFPDLSTTHAASITCAADYGIVSGFADGTFRSSVPITRGQMATFVSAWVRTAVGLPMVEPERSPFSDIDDDVHASAINALAAAGIIGGRPDGTFGSEETLTRGQFTRAVANAISYADALTVDGPLPPDDDRVEFTDVPDTTFEDTILALAGVGIALGGADGAFLPDAPVTRGQLTTFLMRSADYLDRHQRWRPTALSGAVLVADLAPVSVGDTSPDNGSGDDDGSADDDASDGVSTDDGSTEDDTLEPSVASLHASATLSLNAFNGTLAFSLDLSEVPASFVGEGATIHVGDPSTSGPTEDPVAIRLADPDLLGESTGGVVTGVVLEADSAVRFADLLLSPGDAYIQVVTDEAVLRGSLRAPGG